MLPRWNFAYALTSGDIRETGVDWDRLEHGGDAERMFELTHARRPSKNDSELVDRVAKELNQGGGDPAGAGFLCLASPSFQWR